MNEIRYYMTKMKAKIASTLFKSDKREIMINYFRKCGITIGLRTNIFSNIKNV